ncbi:MAG: hypothetical protein WHX52_11950 [Anaerolineae bacterium]
MQDFTGATFGQYKILAPIGEGGMGMVYRAHDTDARTYLDEYAAARRQ